MIETLTIAIGIGLCISLLFGELFGITAGGMIVPGYFAISLNRPFDVLLTLGASLATYAIVRSISSFAIVFGRRRTALCILVGYLIAAVLRWSVDGGFWPADDLASIGYIIPGLIAIWFERQGIIETLSTLITAAVIVRLALILLAIG